MRGKVIIFLLVASVVGGSLYSVYANKDSKQKLDFTAQTLSEKCRGSSLDPDSVSPYARYCYVQFFYPLLKKFGPKYTIDLVVAWAKQTDGLRGECHNVTHILGRYAWQLYKLKSLEGDTSACAFAYGHGVMQEASKEKGNAFVMKNFKNLCYKTTDINGCLHGMGHALYDINFNAPDSAKICESIANSSSEKIKKGGQNYLTLCMEGWSMEAFLFDSKVDAKLKNADHIMDPCLKVVDEYARAGCAGGELRNYVVAADYINFDKKFFNERVKRLGEMVKICKDSKIIIKSQCGNYLGLTAAEVYTLEMDGKMVMPNIEKICNIYGDYCFIPFYDSRYNRLGLNKNRVKELCKDLTLKNNIAQCYKIVEKLGRI